jgi:hypothetical protein
MPTINLTLIAQIAGKLIIVAILAGLLLSFVGSFVGIISSLISNMSGISSTINGLDLGWFAETIGLVSFLNSLMQSFYYAVSIFMSGLVTILGFKFGIRFYNSLMKI